MAFVEKRGVNLQTRFLGYTRREIKGLSDFIQTLQVTGIYFGHLTLKQHGLFYILNTMDDFPDGVYYHRNKNPFRQTVLYC